MSRFRLVIGVVGLLMFLSIEAQARAPTNWLEQMIAYQDSLQEGLPLNEMVRVWSHNSYNAPNPTTTADIFKRPTPLMITQYRSIPEQLDLGVRVLDLDIHWVEQISPDPLYVCRTVDHFVDYILEKCFNGTNAERLFCNLAGIENFGSDTGCYRNWDRTLSSHLDDIASWLTANPNEFLMIQLDWKLNQSKGDNPDQAMTQINNLITGKFSSIGIYMASEFTGTFSSVQALRAANKRIMFFCGPNCPASSIVFTDPRLILGFPQKSVEEFVIGFRRTSTASCCQDYLDHTCAIQTPEKSVWVMAEDRYAIMSYNASDYVGILTQEAMQDSLACGLNPKADRIDYPILGQSVWTWQEGWPHAEVDGINQCAVLKASTGRWEHITCGSQNIRAICINANRTNWGFSATVTSNQQAACQAAGNTNFGAPRTPLEAARLIDSIPPGAGELFWLNIQTNIVSLPPPYIPPPAILPISVLALSNVSRNRIPAIPEGRNLSVFGDDTQRFCSMPYDATMFDQCDWMNYVESVAMRTIALLAIASAGFIISVIFGFIITCCCIRGIFGCSKSKKDADGYSSGEDYVGFDKRLLFFLIPVALILAGLVVLAMGNATLDRMTKSIVQEINEQNNRMQALKSTLDGALVVLGVNDTTDTVDIQQLRRLVLDSFVLFSNTISDFNHGIETWNLWRNIASIAVPCGAIIFVILGVIFMVKKRHRLLIMALIFINFFVFISIIVIILHSVTYTVTVDMCHEVDRPAGLFDVLQSNVLTALVSLSSSSNAAIDSATVLACTQYDEICKNGFQVCGHYPCNIDLLFYLGTNVTLNDNGTSIPLADCPSLCTSEELQEATGEFSRFLGIYRLYVDVLTQIIEMLTAFVGDDTRAFLNQILCDDLGTALPFIYTGSGLLMLGMLVQMALHFWLGFEK